MPGVFLIEGDRVLAEHVHRRISDRPDYVALAGAAGAIR